MNPPEHRTEQERVAQFESVVAAYEAALLRYAGRIVYDADAVQDVVQNTFIRMLHNWQGEWAPGPELSSWLYRVAHNCAVDYLRRETRLQRLHLRHAAERSATEVSAVPGQSAVSEGAERAATALRTLSLREQQLVILKVYEEKSYKEISRITGLTVTNVGYILHHAMKKMAQELQRAKTP